MNRTNGTWVVFLCSCNFRNAFIRSLNIEKKTLWMYVLSFMKWPLVQIIFCIQHSEIWMVTSVACIFIAFVRNHNILKGVRKFIQRWKKKIVLYPEVGQFLVWKMEILCKIVRKIVRKQKSDHFVVLFLPYFLSNQD